MIEKIVNQVSFLAMYAEMK